VCLVRVSNFSPLCCFPFVAPSAGGLFGSPAPAPGGFGLAAPASSGGIFASAPSPSFGTSPGGGGLFSPSSGGAFGTSPAPGGIFGQQQQQQQPSLFAGVGFGGAQPTTPQAGAQQALLSVANMNIIPPVYDAVLQQRLKALETQTKELEKTEVWRGGTTPVSPSTPTNLYGGAGGYVAPATTMRMISSSPRSAAKIRPRGFPKTEVSKPNMSWVGGLRDSTSSRTPGKFQSFSASSLCSMFKLRSDTRTSFSPPDIQRVIFARRRPVW